MPPPINWQAMTQRIASADPDGLTVLYYSLQRADRAESLAFRQAAESFLLGRIASLDRTALTLLAALRPRLNRTAAMELGRRAEVQLAQLPLFRMSPIGPPIRGPAVSAARAGRAPTSTELNISRGGDPTADNLFDYMGTPMEVRTLRSIAGAGPTASVAALIATANGDSDEQIQAMISAAGLEDAGFLPDTVHDNVASGPSAPVRSPVTQRPLSR